MIAMLSILLAGAAPNAAGGGFQSTELLDRMVEQFAGAPIGMEGGARAAVDKRLKLAPCADPQLSWRSAAEDAVVIRCQGPQQWRLFVPVIALPRPVAAAAPTRMATPAVVKPDLVIKRGDPVTVEAGAAGFSISREGIAASDAAAGTRVSIKVDDKRPPIAAIAVSPGRARLPGAGE
jgi:flagella basal body P-ring formation protein FlgA